MIFKIPSLIDDWLIDSLFIRFIHSFIQLIADRWSLMLFCFCKQIISRFISFDNIRQASKQIKTTTTSNDRQPRKDLIKWYKQRTAAAASTPKAVARKGTTDVAGTATSVERTAALPRGTRVVTGRSSPSCLKETYYTQHSWTISWTRKISRRKITNLQLQTPVYPQTRGNLQAGNPIPRPDERPATNNIADEQTTNNNNNNTTEATIIGTYNNNNNTTEEIIFDNNNNNTTDVETTFGLDLLFPGVDETQQESLDDEEIDLMELFNASIMATFDSDVGCWYWITSWAWKQTTK